MLTALLLLFGAGAFVAAQRPDDRTSLIFAPNSGSGSASLAPTTNGPSPSATTNAPTPTPTIRSTINGTGGPMIPPFPLFNVTNGTTNIVFNGTAGPITLPSLNATRQTGAWTHQIVNQTANGTLLIASYPPLNWTLPWANRTHNGTLTFPTFPAFNWTMPGLNRTANGIITIPPFPQLNLTIPWGNGTLNSTVVFPTFPPLHWPMPSTNGTNGTIVFPTFPPLNWTLPGLNWTLPGNGTIVVPTFPPLNWTIPGLNWTLPGNGTVVFPTFPSLNWTIPGLGNSSFTTLRPGNSTGLPFASTTTPRPFTQYPTVTQTPRATPIVWTWVPSNSTGPTTTRAPGTGGTWTPPAWSGWNRTTSAPSVTGTTPRWTGTTTRSPVSGSTGSSRPTSGAPFSPRFDPTTTTARPPFGSSSTIRSQFPGGTSFGTTTTRPVTAMPNSLSDMLAMWRSRFAADMEAVRYNITQYLLH